MATLTFALVLSLANGLPAFAAEPLIPADETTATTEAGYGRVFGRVVMLEYGFTTPDR